MHCYIAANFTKLFRKCGGNFDASWLRKGSQVMSCSNTVGLDSILLASSAKSV